MSKIEVNGVELFYEVKGQGEEVVVFLNGIAMATDHWNIQTATFRENYQVLLHDFRGQGKSSKNTENISFKQHADDLNQIIEQLEIEQIHLVGVSYGAEVAMHFAIFYPEKVKSLTLGTAVSQVRPLLAGMAEAWRDAAATYDGKLFFNVMAPFVYSDTFYQEKKDWLDQRAEIFGKVATKEWFDAFVALCNNFLTLDITDSLDKIQAPTLIVAAEKDILKPPTEHKVLVERIPDTRFEIVEDAGHALFLEKGKEFNKLILDFIADI